MSLRYVVLQVIPAIQRRHISHVLKPYRKRAGTWEVHNAAFLFVLISE